MMKVVQGTFRQIPYWKLRGRFHSCGYRDQEVAEHSGIGRYTMSARMNGHQPWTSKEIVAICELLDMQSFFLVRACQMQRSQPLSVVPCRQLSISATVHTTSCLRMYRMIPQMIAGCVSC